MRSPSPALLAAMCLIPGPCLASPASLASPEVEILQQPADARAEVGANATFVVEVRASGPLTFQWFKNGFLLPGATNRIYTTPRLVAADDQSRFRVGISAAEERLESREAVLTVVPRERTVVKGFLRAEYFTQIDGESLEAFRSDPRYPENPDLAQMIGSFESQAGFGDQYGVRLSGWLIPPTTAHYLFFISSNGRGELFLSPNEKPDQEVLIASEPVSSEPRAWVALEGRPGCADGACENRSGPIWLEAGKRYSIRAEMKERDGPDHLAVTWIRETEPLPANGAEPIPSAFLEAVANTALAPALTITNQPANTTVSVGARATFSVGVLSSPPGIILYQWLKNGEPIPNAVGADYQTPPVSEADHQSRYRVIVWNAGNRLESIEAVLTVGPGNGENPLLQISRRGDGTGVQITFSGRLQSAAAVQGPWTDVTGAVSPLIIPASDEKRFYRAVN